MQPHRDEARVAGASALVMVLTMALAVPPAGARVGVEETQAQPSQSGSGSSSASSAAGASVAGAGWDESEGGFHLGGGDFKLILGGRLQPGFDYIAWDEDLDREDTISFRLQRARLYALGNFMGRDNTFFLQIGADTNDAYSGIGSTDGDFTLFDAWIKHSWGSSFYAKGGQFKTPYSRQNLVSSGKMQFPTRALATEALALEFDLRDVGVELGGGMSEDQFQWAFALVNGDGPNQLNEDQRVGVYARMAFNPSGDYGYAEGDSENSADLASTIGLAGHYQTVPNGDEYIRANLDGGIKYRGWALQGEFYWIERTFEANQNKVQDSSMYLQGGYFIDPRTIELVGRWSRLLNEGEGNDDSEYSAGLNWYLMGHRLKWQTAYTYYDSQADGLKSHRLTTQAQMWF